MKLLAIEIIGFGKWQNKQIDFSDGNQLVFGGNEAGKSTIYQFIQAMLFGFPSTKGKGKKDYTPLEGAAYGGYLWFQHSVYGRIKIERFKNKNRGQAVIFLPDGSNGDEKQLKQLLQPLTKEIFQSIFTFQQEQLSSLDALDEDKLQALLLSVGVSGSQQLLDKREVYFKQAQTIYKGKGTQPPLNQKLVAYKELMQQINEKERKEQEFQQLDIRLEEISQQLIETRENITLLKEQRSLNEKQQQYFSMYEEWRSIQNLPETRLISELQEQKLLSYYQQMQLLEEELTRLTYEISIKSDKPEQAELYEFYLRHEDDFKEITSRRYQLENSFNELEWLKQSYSENQQELFQIGSKWGWTTEQPPQLFLEEAELNRLKEKQARLNVDYNNLIAEIELLKTDIQAREENLSTFEALNKNIFEKNVSPPQTNPVHLALGIGISALLLVSGLLATRGVRIALWCFAVLPILAILFPIVSNKRKGNYEEEKKQWRDKLAQLDYLNEQLALAENKVKRLSEEKRQEESFMLEEARKNHLGTMNQLELFIRYREEITQYLLLNSTNKELELEIKRLEAELSVAKIEIEQFGSWLPVAKKSLREQLRIVQQFSEEMEKIRFSQEYQADAYTRQTMRQLKEKQQVITDEIQPLLTKFSISSSKKIPEKIQELKAYEQQEKREKELSALLSGLFKHPVTLEFLKEEHINGFREIQRLEALEHSLMKKEQEKLYQKQQMLSDGILTELYQKQAELKTEIEELALNWTKYTLSGQILIDLLTELSEQQLPMLLQKMTEYFGLLTNGRYVTVTFSDGKLTVQNNKEQHFSIYDLSTGAKDQLMLAVRFAFLGVQGQQLCPVIIDDGWLHYDDQRKKNLSLLLKEFGQNRQIICFSSDKEMVSYYKENLQAVYNLEGDKNEEDS